MTWGLIDRTTGIPPVTVTIFLSIQELGCNSFCAGSQCLTELGDLAVSCGKLEESSTCLEQIWRKKVILFSLIFQAIQNF